MNAFYVFAIVARTSFTPILILYVSQFKKDMFTFSYLIILVELSKNELSVVSTKKLVSETISEL